MKGCKMVPEISVTSYDNSIEFYTTILGFEIKYTRVSPKFAYLEFEGSQLMIEELHSEGWNVAELVYPFGRGVNFQMNAVMLTKYIVELFQLISVFIWKCRKIGMVRVMDVLAIKSLLFKILMDIC